jgi:hypothetical protein
LRTPRQALVLADLEHNPALGVHLLAAEKARFARQFLAELRGRPRGSRPAARLDAGQVDAARAARTAADVDLTTAFAPDTDFWQAHPQAGIASRLAETKSPNGVDFADGYLRQSRPSATALNAFERRLNGSRADPIAALGKTAFDFSAWLPTIITRRFETPSR